MATGKTTGTDGADRDDRERLDDAIALIAEVPGYAAVAGELRTLRTGGRLRIDLTLRDRAVTDFLGRITVGPEAIRDDRVGLAATLVHERFHRTQPVFAKTLSFWGGVFTRTPVWRRLEEPAYRASLDFLRVLEDWARDSGRIVLAEAARREQAVVGTAFRTFYGE
ncbi:MAG: hypothetical protein SFU56_18620 [Capsulimonadales bacterium]|nr:hypothetical protein [Capsulimonadales bacterium]